MRLLLGPPGSGKTSLVLDQLREAVRAGDDTVRLLVPTATLAQHLQNQVAREGLVLRPRLIQTLSAFVRDWCGDAAEVSRPVLYLIVEEAVRRLNRPEFARVAGPQGPPPGFCASLARTIEEFASAGCRASRLQAALPDAPLAEAFAAVYRETELMLEHRGLALRGWRLERAAERIAAEGAGGIRAVWLDGFHALPDPELRVIAALARHAEVTLTADGADLSETVRARLLAMGFAEEHVARSRPAPAVALLKAPRIEREVEEIARRVLQQAEAGRPFREIGIVVRSAETYVPLLRTTFERFGIPARFYFDEKLESHPVTRFLAGAVDAMLAGWDHAATLHVLRLAPRFAHSDAGDRFDFAVREQLPAAGLGALKELAVENRAESLVPLLERLGALEEWRSLSLLPNQWAARMSELSQLFRPDLGLDRALHGGHARALEWRRQAEALAAFEEALAEAALALEESAHEIRVEPFWRTVKSVLRLKVLRLGDQRRNVVHVLSAPEARQWVLPVVFVCGLVEKEFPQAHRQDPFFPDAARCSLNETGIRVRTAAEFEREEAALFHSAVSRATLLAVLSYPEFDARGERNLRSLYLEDFVLPEERPHPVRPSPRLQAVPPEAGIRDAALLSALREKTSSMAPTRLESYLQCAFQYFGRYTLRLKTRPLLPQERLDFMTQGSIVHDVLKLWYAGPGDLDALFARIFAEKTEEARVPLSYHAERLRNTMLDDLKAFAADEQWPREGWHSRFEEEFHFALEDGLEIKGKIDRLDTAPDGRAYIFDYKYSNAQNTRGRRESELLLQAPLYLMAADRSFHARPAGMFFIGLKGGVAYAGWSEDGLLAADPLPERWFDTTAATTLRAVREIRAGRVEAAPADPSKCRFCDLHDVCRVSVGQAEAEEEAAGA